MTSQLVILRAFFLLFFVPKSEKHPVNQLIKKIWPNYRFFYFDQMWLVFFFFFFYLQPIEQTVCKLCFKTFSCSSELSMKFYLIIKPENTEKFRFFSLLITLDAIIGLRNVKVPTNAGILILKAPPIICSRRQIQILPLF